MNCQFSFPFLFALFKYFNIFSEPYAFQARKLGEKRTVEALARQFQDQIERILTEKGRVEKSYIPSRNEREVNEFRKLNREK